MTHGKIQIQGDSMYPTICDQDWLDIEYFRSPRDLSQFQEGEVLLVRECDQWQIHRAIEINQKMHCKGDWANSEDGPSMAWGQVVAVNGKAHSLLKTHGSANCHDRCTIDRGLGNENAFELCF